MPNLAERSCRACEGGVPRLTAEGIAPLRKQISGWEVIEQHHLHKAYKFRNFQQALDFANHVGAIAEEEGHHPDILVAWGRAEITLWTHAVDGLTENDFILAAKIDRIGQTKPAGSCSQRRPPAP